MVMDLGIKTALKSRLVRKNDIEDREELLQAQKFG